MVVRLQLLATFLGLTAIAVHLDNVLMYLFAYLALCSFFLLFLKDTTDPVLGDQEQVDALREWSEKQKMKQPKVVTHVILFKLGHAFKS